MHGAFVNACGLLKGGGVAGYVALEVHYLGVIVRAWRSGFDGWKDPGRE